MKATDKVICLLTLGMISLSSPCQAKINCTVNGLVADSAKVNQLAICRYDEDPKNAQIHPSVDNGKFHCEIEADEVYKYEIIDFGELLEQGRTACIGYFIVEDGAVIDLNIEPTGVSVSSSGPLHKAGIEREELGRQIFEPRMDVVRSLPDSVQEEEMEKLYDEYSAWELEYFAAHPSIDFLFDLNNRLSYFLSFDKRVKPMLDIYKGSAYSNVFPGHSLHEKISHLAHSGLQMIGSRYNDYDAYDLEGNAVKAFDFLKEGQPTVVIMLATWCAPCRREAVEMKPAYEKYHPAGVNFLGLAREFQSPDAIRKAVEEDGYPWPTILDLDDKFGIFGSHGVTSSGILLIDGNGTIVAAGYDFKDIQPSIDEMLR